MSDLTRWAWILWLLGLAFAVSSFSVSAYSNDDCGKWPGHPEYGITYTGTVAGPQTAACPGDMLGAWVMIPGVGWRQCEDRGGAIVGGFLDVWMPSRADALRWGRQQMNVLVVRQGG